MAKVLKAMSQHLNIKAHVGAMHVVAHTKLKMLLTPIENLIKFMLGSNCKASRF